jgi:hypothetical protein
MPSSAVVVKNFLKHLEHLLCSYNVSLARNASNTPTKLLCRNAPKAANFPGYVNCDYSSVSCSDLGMQHSITEGPNRFPVLKRQTNGSPLPHKTISPKPTIAAA